MLPNLCNRDSGKYIIEQNPKSASEMKSARVAEVGPAARHSRKRRIRPIGSGQVAAIHAAGDRPECLASTMSWRMRQPWSRRPGALNFLDGPV
jgi:hypothetical protein